MSLWMTLKDLFSNVFNGPPDTKGMSIEQLHHQADRAGQEGAVFSERAYSQEVLDQLYNESEPKSGSEQGHSREPGHIPHDSSRDQQPESSSHRHGSESQHTHHDHSCNTHSSHSHHDHSHHDHSHHDHSHHDHGASHSHCSHDHGAGSGHGW